MEKKIVQKKVIQGSLLGVIIFLFSSVAAPFPVVNDNGAIPTPIVPQQYVKGEDEHSGVDKNINDKDKPKEDDENNPETEDKKTKDQPSNPDEEKEQAVLKDKGENKQDGGNENQSQSPTKQKIAISGDYRLGAAVEAKGKDFIWKDANAVKQGVPLEKSYYYLWGTDRYNSYDRKIYSGVRLNFDTNFDSPWKIHAQMAIDPWTFVGVSEVTAPRSQSMDQNGNTTPDDPVGDWVTIKLKYWSGTGSTISEVYRSEKGNIVQVPEIKVEDGSSYGAWGRGAGEDWDWDGQNDHWGMFEIAPRNIHYMYRPIREFFVDYAADTSKIRFFPIGYQDQAYTSDDPLRLSNNHVWWEESPWLDRFEPSVQYTRDGLPIERARWVRRLSFVARDSELQRLTFLRGVALSASPTPATTVDFTMASPMSLWDEYETGNSVHQAARFKMEATDALTIGGITTTKLGLRGGVLEGQNYLQGGDYSYKLGDIAELFGEVAHTYTEFKEADKYRDRYHGYGFMQGVTLFSKVKTFWTYLDKRFYPGLSNYRYTREDVFYGRHINFFPLYPEDEKMRIGDSIDVGRQVGCLKYEDDLFNKRVHLLYDFRNTHKDSGKYLQTISRLETTTKITEIFSFKTLCWYKHLPQTTQGRDPLITTKDIYSFTDYFAERDEFVENAAIEGGKDPSIGHFSLGAKYDITSWMSFIPVYEWTNDPSDFPRTLLNEVYYRTVNINGRNYDEMVPFLYNQGFFSLPPYDYYSIVKVKTIFTPLERWTIFLTFTKNTNKYEGGIDDNVNHVGLETEYKLNDKWRFWFKYMCTRFIDLYIQNLRKEIVYDFHNNFFVGTRYTIDQDQSVDILFGECIGYDDEYRNGRWSLTALDTQHIVRVTYKRSF